MGAQVASKPISPVVDARDPIAVLREEKLLSAVDIAHALGTTGRPWTVRKARRWLQRSGVGFQLVQRVATEAGTGKHGGPWFTTRANLRERFPWLVDLIEQEQLDRAEAEEDRW